ncbi:hypothetical protein ABU614_05885 [Lysobacter firmicutimachus]|uniref:PH domain-containing protein n=1 Tax=Lysobacter firmicutimachus TaxID=1792846 RepID=A0AAU8MYL7_9GAMM
MSEHDEELNEWLMELFAGLNERERKVLHRRFGIDDPIAAMRAAAGELESTRARVRAIQARFEQDAAEDEGPDRAA